MWVHQVVCIVRGIIDDPLIIGCVMQFLIMVRVRVRVKIEVKFILGSAYFVSRSFHLVDLFFSRPF